jgi:uncharacterized protein DUF6544
VRPLADLPAPLRRLAAQALDSPARQVRITQRGHMWLKPGARAWSFTAVQRLAVDRVAFSWSARSPLLGPLALRVVDEFDAGAGALTVSILALPLRREQGPETTRGEALRYLAELPLVPLALTRNPELEFRELDDRHVEVAASVLGERLGVTLDCSGRDDLGAVGELPPGLGLLRDDVALLHPGGPCAPDLAETRNPPAAPHR